MISVKKNHTNNKLPKIILASDHAGFATKQRLHAWLQNQARFQVFDVGTQTAKAIDYPLIVKKAAQVFRQENAQFAILICGTGIGVSMVANRYRFWRAYRFIAGDWTGLKLAREHNNANVLTLNGRAHHPRSIIKALKLFFATPFSTEERHHRRIKQFSDPIV